MTFESPENIVVRAAIFYLAVCVCDVMKKACMCGSSVNDISQPFPDFHW